MTDVNSIPEHNESEVDACDINKSEKQLGAEAFKLLQRQETLFKKHHKVVKDIHDAIIEFGNKLQTGREIYQFDNNGYSDWIHRSKLNTGHIYGGSNGQQELTAARTVANLCTVGYAEDPENMVAEKLDLTECQRVRPTDIIKWARKRQPQLFPKMAKKPGKKKPFKELPDDEIPDLGDAGDDNKIGEAQWIADLKAENKRLRARDTELEALETELAKLKAANALLRAEPGHAPELAPEGADLICSFCSKTNTEVEVMIKGSHSLICDACVELCLPILAERKKRKAKAAAPDAEQQGASPLSWYGHDIKGWVAKNADGEPCYELVHAKGRGKWHVIVAGGERISQKITGSNEAKAVVESYYAQAHIDAKTVEAD